MKSSKPKRILWGAAIVGAFLVAVATAFALNIPGFGKYQTARAVNGVVTIAQAKVPDGKAHYYHFEDGGKEIAFLVVKASDGNYRTAFEACDSCFSAKKGFEQNGDALVCQNCNQRFAIDRIGPHAVGGCNPSYLPSQASAKSITLTTTDLRAGARFF
jgi:uncharacterized membrane protein